MARQDTASQLLRAHRRTLDTVAANNETAALDIMRAIDDIRDSGLRDRLLKAAYRLNVDAEALREARRKLGGDPGICG
ncbi:MULTISPECIES: hypothetical protein [Pseudomonadota]|uniref:hypothetical protein n=1 Tax=Pseudomonadota TaxID=1224 RepID=UPI0009DA8A51|nr:MULTISPECIES: hypothetical protein [Pseudomonadota]